MICLSSNSSKRERNSSELPLSVLYNLKGLCSIKFLAFYDLIKSLAVYVAERVKELSYAGDREKWLVCTCLTVFLQYLTCKCVSI